MLKMVLLAGVGLAQAATASPSVAVKVATAAPSSSGLAVADTCFMMGSKEGDLQGLVIRNGIGPSGTNPIAEIGFFATFVAWLTEDCTTKNRKFTVDNIESNPPGMNTITRTGEQDVTKISNNASLAAELILDWDGECPLGVNAAVDYILPITLRITDPDDPGAMYSPVTFNVRKTCPPSAVVPDEPGWSGFSIFCFVSFILITLFCTIGCGFNYVQRGKTGLEIVPGALYISMCLGKCIRQPRYTPQMDYENTEAEADRYGATYQADL